MIWTKLKALFTGQQNTKGGNSFPPRTEGLTECYAKLDTKNRWQGDVYPKNAFPPESLPTQNVPYWMLINRTCHLYEGAGRSLKLHFLNYVAVYPLEQFIELDSSSKDLKNQINYIVKVNEQVIFLPADPQNGIPKPLVANFNLIYTFRIDQAPRAAQKVIQLLSPFCEHAFQKFSRFFYTVGFDDNHIKSNEYINKLIEYVKPLLKRK